MTKDEAAAIIERIRYPNVTIERAGTAFMCEDANQLQLNIILHNVIDRDKWSEHGHIVCAVNQKIVKQLFTIIDELMTPALLLAEIRLVVSNMIMHEFDELFVFNDVRVFDPHEGSGYHAAAMEEAVRRMEGYEPKKGQRFLSIPQERPNLAIPPAYTAAAHEMPQ